jgi:hypothetical protein
MYSALYWHAGHEMTGAERGGLAATDLAYSVQRFMRLRTICRSASPSPEAVAKLHCGFTSAKTALQRYVIAI